MGDALTAINTRATPQSQPATREQVRNSAGGYTFAVSDDTRIHRFLVLGTDSGTYYVGEAELTRENADVLLQAARERGTWLVEQVVEVSTAGRAPKANPAIFALAAVAGLGDDDARRAALDALPAVCRTGTHLFTFATYVEQFRGWGRGLRTAVANWYLSPDTDRLAYQLVKYRQREGVSHRDLLRLAHPETDEPPRRALLNWAINGDVESSTTGGEQRPVGATREDLPALIGGFEQAQVTTSVDEWVRLIEAHPLSWEMLPDTAVTEPKVWHALIAKGLPQTALMRQLPRLTRLGVLEGETRARVVAQLQDPEALRRGRVHPINVLVAMKTYAQGHGMRSSQTWTPDRHVIDALDAAFYAAFGAVEPAGKRTLVALDVSGSMGSPAGGLPVSCREVAAAMGLVTVATEPASDVVGFAKSADPDGVGGQRGAIGMRQQGSDFSYRGLVELPISPRQRLDDVVRSISTLPFGGTDCSLPMTWALEQGRQYDTMVVVTDSETWAGRTMHPHQALRQYREQTGLDTRLVVVGVASNGFTIAEPGNPAMLDVAGFDAAVPSLISSFSRGDI